MVEIPLEPMLARALIAALELGCAPAMLTVAAMLSAETLFRSEPPAAQRTAADAERLKQKEQLLVCWRGCAVFEVLMCRSYCRV